MVRVRSPGRPLTTCPHDGDCDCLKNLMYVMLEVPTCKHIPQICQHPNRLKSNNRAADGRRCTLAPGVPSRPIPEDILQRLHRGVTKTKGRQSNKGDASAQKAAPKMEHGYSFNNLGLLEHGQLTYQTAFQHATNTSGADALVGSNQGLAAPHLLTPEHSPANPPAITFNSPISGFGYPGHGMFTTGGHSVGAPSDPRATGPAYDLFNVDIGCDI